jgi:hypothetical protein
MFQIILTVNVPYSRVPEYFVRARPSVLVIFYLCLKSLHRILFARCVCLRSRIIGQAIKMLPGLDRIISKCTDSHLQVDKTTVTLFWNVTSCRLVKMHRTFRRTCCPHTLFTKLGLMLQKTL